MNAKISLSVICVEGIIYLSSSNLHDCTFKPPGLLKNRFTLFLPIVDKHNKFYQAEILCVNQIVTILLYYFKIIAKKKLNSNE